MEEPGISLAANNNINLEERYWMCAWIGVHARLFESLGIGGKIVAAAVVGHRYRSATDIFHFCHKTTASDETKFGAI